ncbi:hypothetical protein FVQ98_11215 [Ottowia sp. GY511]|uniref:DUF2971 domain-containing protein n=1 Tax=Ottowia flava TaxID=2675430 RepID=A0ABW4KP94_9BURK|nr:hypothetical protein [Ottowia sp. GY511]TXK27875.1 hypothetical protein FVQ98_11215 [Ottowia sp. GY511]
MRDVDFFRYKYAPTTTHMVFFDASPIEVADLIYSHRLDLLSRTDRKGEVQIENVDGPLESKLRKLLPLTNAENRMLVSGTKSNWALYLSNGIPGTDTGSLPRYLTRTLKVRSIAIVMVVDGPDSLGSMQFSYRNGTALVNLGTPEAPYYDFPTRSVAAHRESKWEFREHGEPLPFEEFGSYRERRIKDRLTPEMIERYCGYLGISLFDLSFYDGVGRLIDFAAPQGTVEVSSFPNSP